jgi:hypothetical protein
MVAVMLCVDCEIVWWLWVQNIINKYGLLSKPPSCCNVNSEVGVAGLEVADVQSFIAEHTEDEHERNNLLLLFDCLRMIAIEDSRPLFIW